MTNRVMITCACVFIVTSIIVIVACSACILYKHPLTLLVVYTANPIQACEFSLKSRYYVKAPLHVYV